MLPEPTDRLRFRRMVAADLEEVVAMLAAFELHPGERPPSTSDHARRWIEWQEPYVEVGYHLLPAMRRRGYATEAARAVRDAAAAHGVEHLVALVRPENLPSQGVARNLGMEVERTAHVHGGDALVFGMVLQQTM